MEETYAERIPHSIFVSQATDWSSLHFESSFSLHNSSIVVSRLSTASYHILCPLWHLISDAVLSSGVQLLSVTFPLQASIIREASQGAEKRICIHNTESKNTELYYFSKRLTGNSNSVPEVRLHSWTIFSAIIISDFNVFEDAEQLLELKIWIFVFVFHCFCLHYLANQWWTR